MLLSSIVRAPPRSRGAGAAPPTARATVSSRPLSSSSSAARAAAGAGSAAHGEAFAANSPDKSATWGALGLAAVAGVAAVLFLTRDEIEATTVASAAVSEPASLTQKVIGQYENRLRELSAPEKLFGYFASQRNASGEWCMTVADFVRSITPYDFSARTVVGEGGKVSTSDLRQHIETPAVFKLIDLDGDGLINFGEYLFFVTLLAIPENQFEYAFKLFDDNGDGEVDIDEFKKVMRVMRAATPVGKAQRQYADEVENAGLSPAFFGSPLGSKKLTFPVFEKFMKDLHSGLLKMEFDRLDRTRSGSISARDFAMQLVSYGNMRRVEAYVERVEKLSTDTQTRISFQQYRDFNTVVKHIGDIDVAIRLFLSSGQPFTPVQLQRAARAVAGVELDDHTVRILFLVYDKDGDGRLDYDEFVGALKSRSTYGLNKQRDFGVGRFVDCAKACFDDTMNPHNDRFA